LKKNRFVNRNLFGIVEDFSSKKIRSRSLSRPENRNKSKRSIRIWKILVNSQQFRNVCHMLHKNIEREGGRRNDRGIGRKIGKEREDNVEQPPKQKQSGQP